MTPPDLHLIDTPPPPEDPTWAKQWDQLPTPWRTSSYDITAAPFHELFIQNDRYQPGQTFDFRLPDHPHAADQIAWWLHLTWAEGHRKIEPNLMRWYVNAAASQLDRHHHLTGHTADDLTDLNPAQIVTEVQRLFRARNHRLPPAKRLRHVRHIAESVHLLLTVRCSPQPWWTADIWDLTADPRIPRRQHEPYGDAQLRLSPIDPPWLREGLRFWFSYCLTYDLYTWTSCLTRARHLAPHFGEFCVTHGLSTPLLVDDPDRLRPLTMTLMSWLRSPAAAPSKGGKPLANSTIDALQSLISRFYEFMVEHRQEAARFTSDPRWLQLTADYTRLWAPELRTGRRARQRRTTQPWMSQADLQQLMACLPILTTAVDDTVTIALPGGRTITSRGLDDPQTMRAWLIQAMTGRRASEILLLDFDPLQTLNHAPNQPDSAPADDAFVARLRYQQTKVDGIDPTILIEQAVVEIIKEQQHWVTEQLGHQPDYLFVSLRNNHQGLRPRSYTSHHQALRRLDNLTQLTDTTGNPLHYTHTHRLRHTRATELLNAGVPVHVVQRYLGHRSPEMTMHYAATLDSVAEAEFLRYKKVGADARDIGIDPHDLYEMAQLDRRTDRILPTGYCLLPPAQTCDRGNACLTCTHYATDATHLDALKAQHEQTRQLIEQRQSTFTARHGQPMGPDHIWLTQRHRELDALQAIIDRLTTEPTDQAIKGAGITPDGRPLLNLTPATDGAHHTTLQHPTGHHTP